MKIANYIEGKLVAPASGAYLDNIEPATGKVYSYVPDSDAVDVDLAVAAARRAAPGWAETPTAERARLLREVARRLHERKDELVRAESVDSGKPLSAAAGLDIPRSIANFEFFADACTQFASESHAAGTQIINYTLRAPLGVVGCISPWNLPLYLFTWKIAPALAAGCAVVAKPSEVTPMTAHLLGEICATVLPPGVLNIIHGLGPRVGARLVEHPHVKAISFTGSTKVGAEIARVAAPLFKKVSLELGGKNPTIVFADADFDAAVKGTVSAAFSNQGQICLCGSRIYVERPIYDRFKAALIEGVRALKLGDPLTAVDQGAVVSSAHLQKVLSYIELAKQEGAKVLTGGKRAVVEGRCGEGYFVEPTLFEGLPSECRTNQEEIFGPVATLTPFDREDEVLAWANSTSYGLAASLWTRDLSRAHRMAAAIESGIVWINCWLVRDLRTPFGGMKSSGVGREGGFEAMRFFTEPKNVCVKL